MTVVNQQLYQRFSYRTTITDTTDDTTLVASLFSYLLTWVADHPEYVLQPTTVQYDIVRYPQSGAEYAEIIWYVEAV